MSSTDDFYDAAFVLKWRKQRKKGFSKYMLDNVLFLASVIIPTFCILQWWRFHWSTNISVKAFLFADGAGITVPVVLLAYSLLDASRWRRQEKRYKQLRHIS